MKEFYDFKDKGDRHIALRPELTAPLIRAVVENKLLISENLPLRIFSYGPVFRYENPQSGRKRQFTQYDIEIIGTNNIFDDIECILTACKIYDKIGFLNKYYVEINFLGNSETILTYTKALKDYLIPFKEKLSEISKTRLEKNPLRILDDKIDGELEFVKNAPKIIDFLTEKDKQEFSFLQKCLNEFGINFKINPNMVRGLDYYTNTVFEFKVEGFSSIGAGGRYAKMVEEFGGDDLSSVGLAFSPERILTVLSEMNIDIESLQKEKNLNIIISSRMEEYDINILKLVNVLRDSNINCAPKYNEGRKINNIFNYAEKNEADFLILFGKKEIEKKQIQIIDLKNKKEEFIKEEEIIEFFKNKKI
jgi:histidyl-tRNA synthetase